MYQAKGATMLLFFHSCQFSEYFFHKMPVDVLETISEQFGISLIINWMSSGINNSRGIPYAHLLGNIVQRTSSTS
jgi:hypothetical protein